MNNFKEIEFKKAMKFHYEKQQLFNKGTMPKDSRKSREEFLAL